MSAEGIDEIRNEVLFRSAFADGFFFVSDDDLCIGDLDDFAARDGELGVDETFNHGALDDDLLNHKIIITDGETDDATEIGVFLCLDAETDEVETEIEDIFNTNDVVGTDKLLGTVDDDAEVGIFADALHIEETGLGTGGDDVEGEDF